MALKPPILQSAPGFKPPKRPASEILEELRALEPIEAQSRVLPEGQDQPVAPEDLGEPRLRAPALAGQRGVPGFAVGVGTTFQEVPSERFERFAPRAVAERKRTARQIPAYPVGSPLIKPGMIEGVDYRTIQPGEVGAPEESLARAFPSPGAMEFPIDPTASPLAAQLATGRPKELKQSPQEALMQFAGAQLAGVVELGETFWNDLKMGAPEAARVVRNTVKGWEALREFSFRTREEFGEKGDPLGPLTGISEAVRVAQGGESVYTDQGLLAEVFLDITNILPVVGFAGRTDDVLRFAKALKDEAVEQGKRVAPGVKRFAAAEAGRPGRAPEPFEELLLRREDLLESVERLGDEIAELQGGGGTVPGIVRPPRTETITTISKKTKKPVTRKVSRSTLVGFSDRELEAIAKQEGRNPFEPDWWVDLDPVAVKEFRASRTPMVGPRSKREAAALVRAKQAELSTLRPELAEVEDRLQKMAEASLPEGAAAPVTPQQAEFTPAGQVTARETFVPEGARLERQAEFPAEAGAVTVRESAAAQARRQGEVARGQGELPLAEGAAPPPREPPVEPPAPPSAEPPPDPRRAAIEAERVRRGLQAPPPLPPESAADKLTRLIQAAKPGRTVTETMRRAEKARRIAIHDSILEAGPPGPETARRARAALGGELPTMEFEALAPQFTPEDVADLFRKVLDMGPGFDRVTANRALEKVLLSGDLPQRGEIAMLERVFGRELAQALVKRGGLSPTAWQNLMDAANIPRVIMTSYDVSAPLRQGLLFSVTRPGEFAAANKAMFQALRSEAATEAIDAAIRVRPNATIAQDAGMYLAPRIGPTTTLTAREEAFMSRFARKIPGVRLSERAYVTYLNKLRADVFDSIYDGWIRAGKTPTDRETQALARYVNLATGRGSLGAFEDAAGVLTAIFFSPRLQAARLELIPHLITAPNAVRKEMIKDMVGTATTGFGILSLASMAGAQVEWDPRSSDFGKIKIGNTRLDIWGGFQQYARMIAQVSTQQRKTLAKGQVRGVDPIGDVAASFARYKLSPQFGAMVDLIDRETAIGDPLLFPPEEGGAGRSVRERFGPMIINDVWDAVAEHGAGGFAVGLPAAFGVGVQTFEPGGGSPSGPRAPRSPRRIPLGGASSTTATAPTQRRNAADILAEWAAAAP